MMQNIQESAATTCVQRIDPSQTALSKQAPVTMKHLGLEMPKPVFTKKDFEEVMEKFSRRTKK